MPHSEYPLIKVREIELHRIGIHYEALPVNAPRRPVHHYHKDGSMRFFYNDTGDAYYEPNSISGPSQNESYREPPLAVTGDIDRHDHRDGNGDFVQPRSLFAPFDAGQRARLFANIAAVMDGVPEAIVQRQLALFESVHPDYTAGVAKAVGVAPLAKNA